MFNAYTTDYLEYSIAVFNRWGEKVYEGHTPEKSDSRQVTIGWDGYYKNELQPNGVYVYAITLVFIDGKVVNSKGSISLIR